LFRRASPLLANDAASVPKAPPPRAGTANAQQAFATVPIVSISGRSPSSTPRQLAPFRVFRLEHRDVGTKYPVSRLLGKLHAMGWIAPPHKAAKIFQSECPVVFRRHPPLDPANPGAELASHRLEFFDSSADRSSSVTRASMSLVSIALIVWSRMLSAALTLVAGGVLESSMILPRVETAALVR
jgi:hypothetical protein